MDPSSVVMTDTPAPSVVPMVPSDVSHQEHPSPPSWLSANLRNVIALAITIVVCYLALMGETTAQAAVVATFAVLAGAIWGERAALKKPGQDG